MPLFAGAGPQVAGERQICQNGGVGCHMPAQHARAIPTYVSIGAAKVAACSNVSFPFELSVRSQRRPTGSAPILGAVIT